MKARCPNCWTVFRVTREHLSARGGKVRCGQCQEIFNALGNLLDDDAEKFSVLIEPGELEGLESLREFPLPEDGRADALKFPETGALEKEWAEAREEAPLSTAPDASPRFSPLEGFDELAPFDELSVPGNIEHGLEILDPPDALKTPESEEIQETASSNELLPPQITGMRVPEREIQVKIVDLPKPADRCAEISADDSGRGDADESIPEERSREADEAGIPASPREIARILADVKGAESFLSGSFRHSDAMERHFRRGAIFLGILLLFQVVARFRGEIAHLAPLFRPPLELLSRAFGAHVPLPRHIESINLEASDLQNDPDRGLLVLSAILRNRAHYGQAYPSLDVLLTDEKDKVIVRRVFDPGEYLPLKLSPRQPFAANSDINIRLWVETRDVKPVGYRLYVVYP
ncbi:MAG: zinc-ribbon domain-containing protein [Candidatus Accumulibacter sp.]|jgi:predicted Zn finger-like uncharacterized protein|nr:zinc-ribbon domain-containing protein [Accumulibacter sp.]